MPKKAVSTTKTRRYSEKKRIPRRQTVIFKRDYGTIEQVTSLTFPHETEIRNVDIDKTPNPDLISLALGNVSMGIYLNPDSKSFSHAIVFDKDGNSAGSFEKHDLKHLFSQIGFVLGLLKKPNGYIIQVYKKGDRYFKVIKKKKIKKRLKNATK